MSFRQDGAVGGGVFMQDADSTMVEVVTAALGGGGGGRQLRWRVRARRAAMAALLRTADGAFVRSLLLQPSLAVAAHDDVRRWAKPSL
jgi:hypothetical protein